jgi:fructokinase
VRIGIDQGGTKIEVIAIHDDGTPLLRRRVETPRRDYYGILNTIVGLVSSVELELSQSGSIGVGMPGAISPQSELIKNANSTVLIGKPFDRDLSEKLGRPVRVENDANCFVLSEATDGAGVMAALFSALSWERASVVGSASIGKSCPAETA